MPPSIQTLDLRAGHGRKEAWREKAQRCWPIVLRELRATSRQGQIFWLRVYSAGVAILTLLFLLVEGSGIVGAEIGRSIFSALNFTLLVTVLTAGPIVTADCISQERREGTLGLLFLTPLKAHDIILSKMVIHGFRAFTMVVAVLPMMALPMVFGGVTGWTMASALQLHIGALVVALCCGMIASVRNVSWLSAVVYAELFCGLSYLLYQPFHFMANQIANSVATSFGFGLLQTLAVTFALFIPVIGFFLFAFEYCRARLRRSWQDDRSTYVQPDWVKFFSKSEFWQNIFKWDKSKTLDRNPIAWLQEYNWTSRLAKWGWCVLILFGELVVYGSGSQGPSFNREQLFLGGLVAMGMSLSAANSFRQERQSGGLELLLVTPLQTWQIIFGRAWGLWAHFFPAAAIFIFNWWLSPFVYKPTIWSTIFLITTYLMLPLMGLFISLFPLSIFVSWLATFAWSILLPYLLITIVAPNTLSIGDPSSYALMMLYQLGMGMVATWLMFRRLDQRLFSWNYS